MCKNVHTEKVCISIHLLRYYPKKTMKNIMTGNIYENNSLRFVISTHSRLIQIAGKNLVIAIQD